MTYKEDKDREGSTINSHTQLLDFLADATRKGAEIIAFQSWALQHRIQTLKQLQETVIRAPIIPIFPSLPETPRHKTWCKFKESTLGWIHVYTTKQWSHLPQLLCAVCGFISVCF